MFCLNFPFVLFCLRFFLTPNYNVAADADGYDDDQDVQDGHFDNGDVDDGDNDDSVVSN